jgi:phosphatidylethanolamine/phosphatidyl-N-methylethanolamine N-methyltransferase
VGCGTGATLRLLSEAVGPRGRVIGLDLTPALLERAWTETSDLPNVQLIRGDASRPPIEGPVDGLLASFVVGLLEDPARAVDDWRSIVGPEGRVALLDGVPTGWAHPFDRGFARLVRAGAPPGSRDGASDRLRRRVEAAHGALRVGSEASSRTSWLAGLVRLTAAGGGPGSCQGSP